MFTSEEVTRLNTRKDPNKWFSRSKLSTSGHNQRGKEIQVIGKG